MSLTPVQRRLLLDGPKGGARGATPKIMKVFGGSASLRVCWHKHRRELLDSCGPGKRPWAYWSLERGMKFKPNGEAGELRLIQQFELYRDEAEAAYVRRRLGEINEELLSRRHLRRVA
jgi:hypothetical protein